MSRVAQTAFKRFWALLGVVALVAVPAQAAGAESEPPAAGQCFTLTKAQLDAAVWPSSVVTVDCALAHNLEIVATLAVPDSVAQRGFQSGDVRAWVARSCSITVNKYAGLSDPAKEPIFSRTWPYSWQPNRAEWAAGDRSVTCGAGVVKPQLSSKGRPTSTLAQGSIMGGYGVGQTLYYITKDRGVAISYSLFAARSLYDEKVSRYPGDAAVEKAASNFCRSQAGMSTYSWRYQKKADWDKGYRWIYCWYAA